VHGSERAADWPLLLLATAALAGWLWQDFTLQTNALVFQ